MLGAYIASQVNAVMSDHGETMVLSRSTEGTTITLKGKRVAGTLDNVGNGDQQTFRVLIGTAELAASAWSSKVPTAGGNGAGDTITVDGRARNVLDVRPRSDGDVVALYDLEVAG